MAREITIQGIKFELPDPPYSEGHVMTDIEASVLNQTFIENVRNNCRNMVIKATEEATKDDKELDVDALQAAVTEYAEGYTFGVRGEGPARIVDPVEREAMALAKDRVKAALKAKGANLKEVGAERINELAAQAVEEHPAFRELAQKRVDEQNALTATLDI